MGEGCGGSRGCDVQLAGVHVRNQFLDSTPLPRPPHPPPPPPYLHRIKQNEERVYRVYINIYPLLSGLKRLMLAKYNK